MRNLPCERKPPDAPKCKRVAKVMLNFRDPNTQKSPVLIYCREHADEAAERLATAGIEYVTVPLKGVSDEVTSEAS